MPRSQILVGLALLCVGALDAAEPPEKFLKAGERALEHVASVVAIGPRPSGSEGMRRQQKLILEHLRQLSCDVVEEDFTAQTPLGARPMKNIVAKFGGDSGRIVVVSGHYDTYARDGLRFVGANDAGSSTGFLLEMASLLDGTKHRDSIWLVFFDGEESTVAWRNEDHTYGSRHQAKKWLADGTKQKVKALINVDMIGDVRLRLEYEGNSTPWLRDLVWKTGRGLGYEAEFPTGRMNYVADDHEPFLERGYPAVDLIDLDYGLFNRYWHTEQDTLDKLSARSLAVMLHVVTESLRELEKRP